MPFKSSRFFAALAVASLVTALAPAAAQEKFPAGSPMANIQKRGKLVIGSSLNTLMFSMRNPMTGETEGLEGDLARLLATKLTGSEKNVEWVKTSTENRLPFVQNGRVDLVISTLTINDARKKVIGFAGPYFIAGQDILTRNAAVAIQSAKDLGGKTTCVLNGTTGEDNVKKLAPTAKLVTFNDSSACVEGVVDGRFDAYVDDGAALAGELVRQPNKFRIAGSPFTQEPYGIGVAKENEALRQWVNLQLAQAVQDGTWQKLYQKNMQAVLGSPQVPTIER